MRQQVKTLMGSAMLALLISAPAIGAGLDVSAAVQAGASTERLMLADVSSANTFNRNLKKEKDPNAPPPEDGYHDPEIDGLFFLLVLLVVFVGLFFFVFGFLVVCVLV